MLIKSNTLNRTVIFIRRPSEGWDPGLTTVCHPELVSGSKLNKKKKKDLDPSLRWDDKSLRYRY